MIVALLQVALWTLLAAACAHLLRSAIAARGPLPPSVTALPDDDRLPAVTVQLPVCNEGAIVERLLRAACALDWPADRLELQLLDDSDPRDACSAVADRVAAELVASGHDLTVLRRGDRRSFKAGNLAHGLARARGSFVAVLDADSVPPADLLRRLIAPLLTDETLGFAQARWSFENERAGLLTRAQALILDGLMLVEQPLLSARRLPLQFNGTAGVWRRAALEAAGGWRPAGDEAAASVTEDLDLSYRARLAGFGGAQVATVAVQTELPETMAAFRAQQRRWVRGGAEVLRTLFHRIVHGEAAPRERLTMLAHLARHARQPLLAAAALSIPAAALGWIGSSLPPRVGEVGWAIALAALWGAMGLYFGAARRRLGRSALAAFALAPTVIVLSIGLALPLTASLLAGVIGGGREAEFVRTPKRRAFRAALDPLALVETVVGMGEAAAAAVLAARGEVAPALGVGLLAAGWLWVGGGSLVRR